MFILLLLTTTISLSSQDDGAVVCDGLVFNNNYYDKQVLFQDYGQAYNLVVHEKTEQLFFSRPVHKESYNYRNFVTCHMKTKVCNDIDSTVGGNAVFYHRDNDDLYLGAYNGIHQYDFKTKMSKLVAEPGKSIWGLFVSNSKFYYISYPEQKLYAYTNNTFEKVKEVADVQIENFFVSKNNIVYFSNSTALYRVEKPYIPFDEPIVVKDKIIVRQIVDDFIGTVYFCASDGVYIDDANKQLKKIADIENAYGMAIIDLTSSKGHLNILYSNNNAIYKLEPSNNSACINSPEVKNKTFGFSIQLNVKKPHRTRFKIEH